jgi:hypothetical protein
LLRRAHPTGTGGAPRADIFFRTKIRCEKARRSGLLKTAFTPQVFDELVRTYLSTGAGIGMQPKIMVPERSTVPVPSLIVKAAGPAYPGLAANEYLCLGAAQAGANVRRRDHVHLSLHAVRGRAGA